MREIKFDNSATRHHSSIHTVSRDAPWMTESGEATNAERTAKSCNICARPPGATAAGAAGAAGAGLAAADTTLSWRLFPGTIGFFTFMAISRAARRRAEQRRL